jgi:transposase
VEEIDEQISQIERHLRQWQRQDTASQRIAEIPGVGPLSAAAAVATMGDAKVFRSGREFAAWLGLVPRQSGTGGGVRLLGISKRGDKYLRTLLIHGARAVLTHSTAPPQWLTELAKRRPKNVVVVAMANKMARTIWALMAHERAYQSGYVSQPA